MMGRYGELTAFELMEEIHPRRRAHPHLPRDIGTTPLRVQFTSSADGKIAGLGIPPVN